MPVPASINDLSTTAASNYPQGSEPALPLMDDYMRTIQSFVAFLRDNKLNTSAVSSFIMTLLDDADAATARTTLGAVGLTGAETIAGVKTFSSSPVVPTAAAGDNSTKAASTAYADAAASAAVSGYERLLQIAAKPTTSGTSVLFSGADAPPAWTKRITVVFDLVSTNGTDQVCVPLGTSGGIDKTGYQGSSCFIGTSGGVASTIGSGGATLPLTGAAATRSGRIVFHSVGGNVWEFSGQVGDTSAGNVIFVSGRKGLGAALTQLAVTTINETDAFDGGQVSVIYEG